MCGETRRSAQSGNRSVRIFRITFLFQYRTKYLPTGHGSFALQTSAPLSLYRRRALALSSATGSEKLPSDRLARRPLCVTQKNMLSFVFRSLFRLHVMTLILLLSGIFIDYFYQFFNLILLYEPNFLDTRYFASLPGVLDSL